MARVSFSEYVLLGDCVYVEDGLFSFRIRVEPDIETKPTDFDCYSKKAVKAWEREDWFFCGLVVSAEYNGVPLNDDSLACLWSIEANFPGSKNRNMTQIALELLPEAKEAALYALEEMREALDA